MFLRSLRAVVKRSSSPAHRSPPRLKQPKQARHRLFQPRLEKLEERTLLSAGYFLQHLPPGQYLTSYAGVGFIRDQVATLYGPTGLTTSNTPVQINWGDKSKPSWGELVDVGLYLPGSEMYLVKGSHTYQQLASSLPITVTVVGKAGPAETAETSVSAMPSGLPGTPPPCAYPFGAAANVSIALLHLNAGADIVTQAGNTTPVPVASFSAQLNGQPDLVANPKGHFAAYINWGNSSDWTTGQIVFQGSNGFSGLYTILGPPPYTQPTPPGTILPIVVYLQGPDGTSASRQTADATVLPGPLTGIVACELKQILPPSAPAPTVTLSGNVMTATWGGLTITNDVSTAAPAAVSRESPSDVKTFVDMLKDAASRSLNLRNLLWQIVNDPAHPVTVRVGSFIGPDRTSLPVVIDSFETKMVDVGQLGEVPTALPADQGITQGELIAHILGERYYAATVAGSDFDKAHLGGGIPKENAYRANIGATSMVEDIVRATPAPGFLAARRWVFIDDKQAIIQVYPNYHIQVGPVFPLPIPFNLGNVSSALTHSAEYYSDFVTNAYQTYLGRQPDQAGLAGWVQAMQNGLSDEHLEAGLIGSAEYIANHGGAGAGWVIGMYHDLLGRTPSQDEVNAWVNALEYGVSTQQVAYGFAASAERESIRVRDDYLTFLGRSPSPGEVSAWVNAFLRGASNEDVIAGFVGSVEDFRDSGSDIPTWLDNAYQKILGHQPDPDGFDGWLTFLTQDLPSA
jgi:hypothetical protein